MYTTFRGGLDNGCFSHVTVSEKTSDIDTVNLRFKEIQYRAKVYPHVNKLGVPLFFPRAVWFQMRKRESIKYIKCSISCSLHRPKLIWDHMHRNADGGSSREFSKSCDMSHREVMVRSRRWEIWVKHFRDVEKFSWTTLYDTMYIMFLLPFSNWGFC